MAAVKASFGFKPSRSLGGVFNPAMRRFAVLATGVRPMFVGDPVVLLSSNVVRTVTPTIAVTAVIGVVGQLLDTNQKPLVFSQPLRGPFLPIGTAGYADVYTDPNNIYWSATDATAAVVNQFAFVTAAGSATQNNQVGRSPLCIAYATGTAVSSTEYPFQIIGPAAEQRDALVNPDWTEGVEVIIARSNYVRA